MDRGSTEVEIHCACAWRRYLFARKGEDSTWVYDQTHWCRLHMEAEITKQGQAAGTDVSKDSESPASPANANLSAKRGIQ